MWSILWITYVIKWMNLKSEFCLYFETEGVWLTKHLMVFFYCLISQPYSSLKFWTTYQREKYTFFRQMMKLYSIFMMTVITVLTPLSSSPILVLGILLVDRESTDCIQEKINVLFRWITRRWSETRVLVLKKFKLPTIF